jgi:hypothetical protein
MDYSNESSIDFSFHPNLTMLVLHMRNAERSCIDACSHTNICEICFVLFYFKKTLHNYLQHSVNIQSRQKYLYIYTILNLVLSVGSLSSVS